jgi:ABC-type uncharacterized transport system ATPase subunit
MQTIQVDKLSKTYRVYRKREGVLASIGGLFHREYGEVHVVSSVSFEIGESEMVAFLGPNGAGKTTTLKRLSGLIFPTFGTANVLGHTPWKRENAYRRRFSLVMGQKNQLWWDLPAQESFRLHQEIVDRFSDHKVAKLQCAGSKFPDGLDRCGTAFDERPPSVSFEVPRATIADILSTLLSEYAIEDVSVNERPLEEIVAKMFTSSSSSSTDNGNSNSMAN